jgi:hypothetical protein
MIDVNKITSTLAKLPDQQLQQYAQMHKSDPYIMALAMSESNRRKELRAAGQGAQGMQEQPKVVDQMVAEMAPRPAQPMPEDQGIGQLPAGEMNFAGGGIVAFADGGDVERYSGEFGSFIDGLSPEFGFSPAYMPGSTPATPDPASMRRVRASPYVPAQLSEEEALLLRRRPAPIAAPKAAPRADTTKKSLSGPPATQPAAGLPALQDPAKMYQDILSKQNFQDPAAEASLQLEAQERINAAADRQAIVRDAERFKDAYKGREGRLAEREADIGKQKGTNTGLAFLNAGLAIMSTPGGLASAIGKGAQVGTAQFAAGLDKIRSAQERLGEARDRLEDLKLNREDISAKDLREADRRYRDVAINSQKRTIEGVRMAAGVNETRAKNIYDKTMGLAETVYKEQQANVRTDKTVAGMLARTGDTAGLKGDRVAIDALKAQATNVNKQLEGIPAFGANNLAKRQPLEAQLAQINAQLAQLSGLSTMLPAPPAGAGSGLDLSQWGKSQVVKP